MTITRPTGAIARILDPETLLAAGRIAYLMKFPDANPYHLTSGPTPQMLIAVDRGIGAVVNGEGVGERFTENDTVEVYFDNGGTYFPLTLTTNEIANAATDELIDLADGIRTFGDRLNSNHRTWFNAYDSDYTPHAE